ncbi:mucin-7 [Cololabis saira]|uniref:mucin-7 n=1 Tax=Cololabis saira TaxID=129043 RepID=UPI002AD20F62|nr:mucin-7 [Cololabis saira]
MKVQHLLLLALAGPFCAFTWAAPTMLPEDPDNTGMTDILQPTHSLAVITGPAPTDPTAIPNVAAEPSLPPGTVDTEANAVTAEAPYDPSTAVPQSFTSDAPAAPEATASAEETTAHAEVPADPTPEAPAPAEETAAPAVPTEPEERTEAPVEPEGEQDVIIDDKADEGGLSSGQITGIVIGALLAMVIVSAVVIAAVRRMGKYSP